ncbi:MAG: hypothetical protein CVV07_00280 [Gammaproteobacteria bacterium HGW-Gammaproteobacteria-11]|nr:MAG: hypothetical protein CVV07_00280 [Gammaproteobacteria bacterium HGW-Gammaproteobacteria-11]
MSDAEISVGSNDQLEQGSDARAVNKWGGEICYTWAVAILICVVPAVIYGASFPAGFLLLTVVIFGVPTGLGVLLLKNKTWSSLLWRRLVVLGAVAIITNTAVSQTDKLTPGMATPIADAIAQYKTDTRKYPDALTVLRPIYLANMPAIRAALIQPAISYTVRDGRPRLVIPSAIGDAFANYEYDFEAKIWVHNY